MGQQPAETFSSDSLAKVGLIGGAVLSVLLVALSTYGRRRCSHPVVRLLVLGASIIYIPLTSQTISSLLRKREYANKTNPNPNSSEQDAANDIARDMWTLLLWIVLILMIKGNSDMAAAAGGATAALPSSGDVSIDGQRISPSVGHLFQYAYLGYLIWQCLPQANWVKEEPLASVFIAFTAVGLAKTLLKLAASYGASRSFALGKNARLIAGYMSSQSQLVAEEEGQEQVPRYIVVGEREKHVKTDPQGYRIKREVLENKFSSLVTLDHVWQQAEHGDGILAERRELRDLCLSYSLFKILRRRLSGYPVGDAGSSESLEFVLRGMDSVGAGGAANTERLFRVLVDELWFASDFYYSPLPLCILSGWCAALNCLFSVLIIAGAICLGWIYKAGKVVSNEDAYMTVTYSLLVVTVLVEIWEIVSGLWSNWFKMTLLGHYICHESAWRRYSCIRAALSALLRLRPARRWRDEMGQNSVLEPGRFVKGSGFLAEKLYGRAGLMRSVPVSAAVKDAVLRSLLSSHGRLTKDSFAARRLGDWAQYGSQKCWASYAADRSSTTELILMWHVGTRLFEIKSTTATTDMAAASHLSNYFAYLVAEAPELLPDCAAWTEERYREVTEDVRAALGGGGEADGESSTAAERYERLAAALSATSRDTVLRRGAEIGRHLVKEYTGDEASASRVLADFWSEILLYVAPSENIKGHVQAMARGGEFVTLVWALLFHAGVTTRPDPPGTAIV